MSRLVVYVSHPRNGGTELAREIGRMLTDSLGATVYFPLAVERYGVLDPSDIATLAAADVILAVLNREAATQSVPKHIVQHELRELTSRSEIPVLIVIRAEPCPIPEAAQGARLALAAGNNITVDELVSKIVEDLVGRSSGPRSTPSDPLRRYLEGLRGEHGVWSTRYTRLGVELPFDQQAHRPLITDLAASAELDALLPRTAAPLGATLDPAWTGTDTSTRKASDVRDVLYAHRQLALIGEPGSGKTTTLRSLVADLAVRALSGETDLPVPVVIRLGTVTVLDIEQEVAEALAPATTSDLAGRDIWLLLDGLNETTAPNVETVLRWLKANPQTRFIVTSRRADYDSARLPIPVAELLPLDVGDIPGFLTRWGLSEPDSQALFWALAGEEVERIWRKWEAAGETFENFWSLTHARESLAFRTTDNFDDDAYDAMRRRMLDEGRLPSLLDVVRSPFLLTLTIAIYNRLHELPRRRAQLFESYVDALLQHLVREDLGVSAEQARSVFAAIAGAMNDTVLTSMALKEVAALVADAPADQVEAVLRLGSEASIIDRTPDRVRFSHQLLQDYFAAFALADMISRGEPPSRVWREDRKWWWSPTMWDEAAVLLTGLVGYNDRITDQVGSPWDVVGWVTPISPTVAWRCVEENRLDIDHPRAQVLRRPTKGTRAAPGARILLLPAHAAPDAVDGGVLSGEIPRIDLLHVPAGEFVFGLDEVLDLPAFWIAQYPVTNCQFALFSDGQTQSDPKFWEDMPQDRVIGHGRFSGPTNPRDSVNWYEARAFCRWLTVLFELLGDERVVTGEYVLRLPTEREWEKAARGVDGRVFPWGSEFDPTRCNTLETGLRRTSPVGIFPDGASPFGAEDMAGNVWEWCSDHYVTEDGTAFGVVNRGGSCFRDSMRARSSYRGDCLPGYHSSGRGFRVVLGSRLDLPL